MNPNMDMKIATRAYNAIVEGLNEEFGEVVLNEKDTLSFLIGITLAFIELSDRDEEIVSSLGKLTVILNDRLGENT